MLKKVVATAAATGGLVLTGAGLAAGAGGAGRRGEQPRRRLGQRGPGSGLVPVNLCGNTGQRRRAAQPTHGNVCVNK
ncbi:DUF320 domain containing protein [Pyrenophora tritici-repentis]|nr:DUF320 domain containing protein [Pyrenophora tritici-repentis]